MTFIWPKISNKFKDACVISPLNASYKGDYIECLFVKCIDKTNGSIMLVRKKRFLCNWEFFKQISTIHLTRGISF